jgi:F-type H+-transporting ATPase subunit epsilon
VANLTYVELITPERVLFSGEAEAVVMRTDGGDITFLANHMDYIAAVDLCVVRVQGVRSGGSPSDGVTPGDAVPPGPGTGRGEGAGEAARTEQAAAGEVFAAVHGGFVMVADNKVTIVSGVAELAEEIDVGRAQRALESAEAGATGVPADGAPAAPGTGGAAGVDGRQAAGDESTGEATALEAAARARVRLDAAGELKGNLSHL